MATSLLANEHGGQSNAAATTTSVEDRSCLAFADGAASVVAVIGDADTAATEHVRLPIVSAALSGFATGFAATTIAVEIVTTATIEFAVKKAIVAVSKTKCWSKLAATIINY